MLRDEIIETLHQHMPDIRAFGVARLAVFGSVSRGEETPDSDVDVLVEFEAPAILAEALYAA